SLGFDTEGPAFLHRLGNSRRGLTLGFRLGKSHRSKPRGLRVCGNGSPSFYLSSRSLCLGVGERVRRHTVGFRLGSSLAISLLTISLLAISFGFRGDIEAQTIRRCLGGCLPLSLKGRAIADVRGSRRGGCIAGFTRTGFMRGAHELLQPAT